MNFPFHRTHKQEAVNLLAVSLHLAGSSRLKDLVGDNPQMYLALQNFLLLDPEKQVLQLGEVNTLLGSGDIATAKGNNLAARANYETAAKIEIYRQNKDSARNCLLLAQGVSEKGQLHHEFQETMLADMDEVLRISKLFNVFPPLA